jgi:hypothetical protein
VRRTSFTQPRVRAGLVPGTRRGVFERIKHLKSAECPFANLPELTGGRWGQGFTAEKMKECVWLRPELVAQIQFLEWTGADHLRHTKFVGLRDDKDPFKVVRDLMRPCAGVRRRGTTNSHDGPMQISGLSLLKDHRSDARRSYSGRPDGSFSMAKYSNSMRWRKM